jgi:hypothetical protein
MALALCVLSCSVLQLNKLKLINKLVKQYVALFVRPNEDDGIWYKFTHPLSFKTGIYLAQGGVFHGVAEAYPKKSGVPGGAIRR